MKAKLFHVEDEQGDLFSEFELSNPDRFCFAITALIGPEDEPNGEIFQATFTNRKWIADYGLSNDNIVNLRGYFLVEKFSQQGVVDALQTLVSRAKGETWRDLANWLNKYLVWEFDDYQG